MGIDGLTFILEHTVAQQLLSNGLAACSLINYQGRGLSKERSRCVSTPLVGLNRLCKGWFLYIHIHTYIHTYILNMLLEELFDATKIFLGVMTAYHSIKMM